MTTTKFNGRDQQYSTICDYKTELDFKSGIDESLRYTKRGYRRSDEEILGIMKKRRQKKAAKQKQVKLERKIRNKAQTLLRKKLRGSGFEELNEGDFYRSIETSVLDDIAASSPKSEGVSEKTLRRQQHKLVQEANKRNSDMKKKRKQQRRAERVVSEANETLVCTSTTCDEELKMILGQDPHEIEFASRIDRGVKQLLKLRGYEKVSDNVWRSKHVQLFTEESYQHVVQSIPEEQKDLTFDEKDLEAPEVAEFDRLYLDIHKETMDIKAKLATIEADPDVLSAFKDKFVTDTSSGLMKWLHSKSNDKVLIANVDMVVSLIDMVWLVYSEPNINKRMGIVHLWMGTLGLEVETKWACSALAAVVLRLITETPKVVSESWSSTLEEAVSFAKKVHNTPFVMAVRDLFVSLASLKFFKKEVAINIYHYLGKPRESSLTELSFLAIESLARVLRVAELIYGGVPLSKALFSENPTELAKSTAKTLIAYQNNLYTGLPVEGKMCQREWLMAAKNVAPILDGLVKTMNPFKSGFREVQSLQLELNLAYSTIRNQVAGSSRIPPFCIVLHGNPGIGKSTIMNFLFRIHSDVKKRIFDESHVFHRIVSSDYWEGYDSFSHPYVHYSELGNKNAQLVRTQGDECISELTSVIDSLPMPLNMAFGDKGKTFFLGEMIVIDTNNPDMNLNLLFSNPSAFRRRFIYVEPTVLPEFRKDGSCGIDYEKSKDQRLIDKYTFRCYVKKEVDVKNSEVVDILEGGGDVDKLYDALYVLMRDRIARESALLQMKKNDVNTKYGTIEPEADDFSDLPNPYADDVVVPDYKGDEMFKMVKPVRLSPIELEKPGKLSYIHKVFKEGLECIASSTDLLVARATILVKPNKNTEKLEMIVDTSLLILTVVWLLPLLFSSPIFAIMGSWFLFNIRSYMTAKIRNDLVENVLRKKQERLNSSLSNMKAMLTGDYMSLLTPYVHRGFCALAATGGLLIIAKLIHEYFIKKHSEDSTEFVNQSDSNSVLNRNEEMIGAAFSQKRIQGRLPETWAIRTLQQPIAATCSLDELATSCNGNLRFCRIETDDKVTRVCLFGICSNFAIIPTHALPSGDFLIHVSTTAFSAVDSFKSSKVSQNHIVDVGNDMSLISLSQVQFRDVTKHLNNVSFSVLNGKIANSSIVIRSLKKLKVSNPKGDYIVDEACTYKWSEHRVGLCGMPVYGKLNGGPIILGIHCAGKTGTLDSYGALFDLKRITDGIVELRERTNLMTPVSQADFDVSFKDPGFKSPFRHLNLHNVEYYGSDGRAVIMPKGSALQRTKLFDVNGLFNNVGVEIKEEFMPPIMRPKFIDGKYVSPQNNNLVKINTSKRPLDRNVLAKCVDHFVNRVVSELREKGVKTLSPLTFQEAINGSANDAYLRRINVATGAGYGFKGKKREHLPLVSEEKDVVREPTESLKKRLVHRQDQYLHNESSGVIYGAKLKDEPRAREKVLKGKTRMFYPAPVDYLILCRQVLAPIFTLMVEHRNVFNMSVGINMFSEGAAFYDYFAEFADSDDCIFDGDYGGFDTSMPYDIGLAASSVMVNLARALGYNEEALALVRGVMSDSLFPILELDTDVFKVAGLMTSGGYGTAEFNCIRNNLLMMYYFATTEGLTLDDYDNKFRKSTYGDDVTGVVKKSIQHLFNNVLYAKYCEEVLGMEFTSPDKKVNSVPLRRLDQLTFLKRTFVKHPHFGTVMAVLDYESIAKSLKWHIPSEALSSLDQIIATANSSLWEMFMHLSREDFETYRRDLISMIGKSYNVELSDKDVSATWLRICRVLCPNAMELREEEALSSTEELTLISCDVDDLTDF